MVSKDNLESIREDDWLEVVYGTSSRLENDAWLEKVQEEGAWITDPEELRAKILEKAELDKIYV